MARKQFTITRVNQTLVRPAAPSIEQNTTRAGTSPGGLYYLSNFDFLMPSHTNTIYCYKPPSSRAPAPVASKLKDALEKALAYYCPFAGRLVKGPDGRLAVDCSVTQQSGTLFIEAEADADVEDIGDITEIDPTTLGLMVSPRLYDLYDGATLSTLPSLIVQITMFRCGGFVLGVRLSHVICDGIAAMEFLNSWAEIARGVPLTTLPSLDRTILKPRNPLAVEFSHPEFRKAPPTAAARAEKCAALEYHHSQTRSFMFNLEQLSELKSRVSVDAPGEGGTYTSLEALMGLIWRSWAVALGLGRRDSTEDDLCTLIIPVDARQRFDPPLPTGFMGNAYLPTSAACRAWELVERPPAFAAGLVREAIKKVTTAYLRSAIDYLETGAGVCMGDDHTLILGTWSRLEFYRHDFGWGQPMYVGPPSVPSRKFIILLPSPEIADDGRRGVQIMLSLPEQAMLTFQEQIEGKAPWIRT